MKRLSRRLSRLRPSSSLLSSRSLSSVSSVQSERRKSQEKAKPWIEGNSDDESEECVHLAEQFLEDDEPNKQTDRGRSEDTDEEKARLQARIRVEELVMQSEDEPWRVWATLWEAISQGAEHLVNQILEHPILHDLVLQLHEEQQEQEKLQENDLNEYGRHDDEGYVPEADSKLQRYRNYSRSSRRIAMRAASRRYQSARLLRKIDNLEGDQLSDSSDDEGVSDDESVEDPEMRNSGLKSKRNLGTAPLLVRMEKVSHLSVNNGYSEKLKTGYFVTITVERTLSTANTETIWSADGFVEFDMDMDLGQVVPSDQLILEVYARYFGRLQEGIIVSLGVCRVCLADMVRESVRVAGKHADSISTATIWIRDKETDIVVFDEKMQEPTRVQISLNYLSLLQGECGFPEPRSLSGPHGGPAANLDDGLSRDDFNIPSDDRYEKHVFVVTRGTRGDVQPFIALARGLAEQCNFLVTICTEDRYRPLIERYSKVRRGAIQFRTSGGDTEKRISTGVARWALRQNSMLLQLAMLGHSEREFFDSEPMFYYWCRSLRPDVILFGFTTTHIAMILSESLEIPLIGFLLQPTVIPSKQYPAIALLDNEANPVVSHIVYERIKVIMENNPFDFNTALNTMRRGRGLEPFSHRVNDHCLIVSQNIPVIVPINEVAFGGKPQEWHSNAALTDFIFLRSGAMPDLAPKMTSFLMDVKHAGDHVVVMAFSSMPVARTQILELAIMMIEQCETRPRVIALVGNSNALCPDHAGEQQINNRTRNVEEHAMDLICEGRLLVEAGAPFSKLFPQVDCIIAHGGLGTTGEILRAAKPCLTTGVLIMDQRFWGRRIYELGCGPPPIHVEDLESVLVDYVDTCLVSDSAYATRAKEVAQQMDLNVGDGVDINVQAFAHLLELASSAKSHRESIMRSSRSLFSAVVNDTRRALGSDVAYVRGLITSMAVENAKQMQTMASDLVSSHSSSSQASTSEVDKLSNPSIEDEEDHNGLRRGC